MSDIEQNLAKHIPSLITLWRESCGRGSQFSAQKKTTGADCLSPVELQTVSKALLDLQRGLTGTRQLAGAGYMDNASYVGAYLLYYWPVSYLQISYAMNDVLKQRKTNDDLQKKIVRILDLGSGPAPASAAIIDALHTSSVEVHLFDSSIKALSLAKKIIAHDFPLATVQTSVCNFENENSTSAIESILSGEYDVIVMSHALNELWKDSSECIKKRTVFIEDVAAHLTLNGMMLLCEPALLTTSRNLISVRDSLIQKGFSIIAPCVRCTEQCPAISAGENHTCHVEVEWQPCEPVSALAKSAGLDRESVKMTYFALKQKIVQNENAISSPAGCVTGRVVSEGMLNKAGRIRYLICDGIHRVAVSAKKDDVHAKELGLFSLKRYDFVTIENPEVRGGNGNKISENTVIAYGIADSTKLAIARFNELR